MAGATTWWKAYKEVFRQETLAKILFGYHEKHGKFEQASKLRDDIVLTHREGEIVRVGPNEVSDSS